MNFAHLHVHTDASNDGIGTVYNLVAMAKKLGFEALAMTDHGTVANAISFTDTCKRNKIKPILGLEAYVEYNGVVGHLTLLADGTEGFKNIIRLNNLGQARKGKSPAFTIEQLITHNEDIIVLTGCQNSPLQKLPLGEAIMLGSKLKLVFGDRLYSEAMFISDTSFDGHWKRALTLAEALELPIVITNDCHFPLEEDARVHQFYASMALGFSYYDKELWLKSDADIFNFASKWIEPSLIREGLDNAAMLAEKIRPANVRNDSSIALPKFDDPIGKLKRLLQKEWDRGDFPKKYANRLRYELSVIEKMNFGPYFLILNDIIWEARQLGIKKGPGRGSGVGSLVLYILGITDVDPIKYGLQFERFLHEKRKGFPDVDLDFDAERRGEILEYAKEKWGAFPIASYSRYKHRSLIADLARQSKIPSDLAMQMSELGVESKAFRQVCKTFPMFESAYNLLLGQIRHKSKHAGGVVICRDVEIMPLERVGDDLAVAWAEGHANDLSYAGYVKFDLLGLSALSILARLEKKHKETPKDDPNVYKLFHAGCTDGIFQFTGSDGIRDLTIKMRPNSIEDLAAISALYRPGPLRSGNTQKFLEWKKNPRKIHPLIDDILKNTYGAIIYQEQVMAIVAAVLGGDMVAGDQARILLSKASNKWDDPHWMADLKKFEERFIIGCVKNGIPEEIARPLWSELKEHAGYSFNKSHSIAYAYISYEMAFYKFFFPGSFYAELLNVDTQHVQEYMLALTIEGFSLNPPKINTSTDEYTSKGKGVFMPLGSVKYLGQSGVDAILEARKDGPFVSMEDFVKRVPKRKVNKRARQGLFSLGAFSEIPLEPSKLEIDDTTPVFSSSKKTSIEQEYLGVVLPDAELVKRIQKYKKEGILAGIVVEVTRKRSAFGPYISYKLSPEGTFWERTNEEHFEKGDFVKALVSKTRKAIKAEKEEI